MLLAGTAVIVTHNSAVEVEACLDALADMAPQFTPIVVDNASTDDTVERLGRRRGLRLVANTENLGFAGAVNQAVETLPADFILLLNPDARLLAAVDGLTHSAARYGLAAGKLVDQKGKAQKGFTVRRFPTPMALAFELFGINRLWPTNPVNRRYRCLDRDLDQPGFVDQPAGAFLMVRGDVWRRLGGFDTRFHPVWYEDVDFCRRAVSAGFQIHYFPTAVAEHSGGHSVGRIPPGCRALYWCVSLLKYGAKHFPELPYRGICLAVMVSSVPRMIAGMIQSRNLAPLFAYSKVIWAAGLCLLTPRSSRPGVGLH